jgi:signal peptidase I
MGACPAIRYLGGMTSPQLSDLTASRHPWVRDVLLIVIVLAGLWSGGCATHGTAGNLATFVTHAPLPTLVPRAELVPTAERQAATHEGDFVLRGFGRSMEPVYVAGTVVVVHPTAMHMLRKGMAVVYTNARGGTVAHMLLEKNERGWIAIGLNNAEPDGALVTEKNLVGIVKHAFVADDTVFPAEIAAQISLRQALTDGAPLAWLH